jgi:hypothetical protein
MKEFKFHIPVDGLLSIPIVADTVEEALEILLSKKDVYEHHPLGNLNLKIEDALAVEANPKIVS